MLDYEYGLRDEALIDLMNNYKSNFKKGTHFDMKFLTLKREQASKTSISVLSKFWNCPRNFYSSVFRSDNLKSSEPLPEKLPYTCRLLKINTKKYYLSIPKPLKMCENQAPKTFRMVSIDPGVKTFFNLYSPTNGYLFEIGKDDIKKIAIQQWRIRKLQKQIAIKKTKTRKMRLLLAKWRTHLDNLIDNMQKCVSKWLLQNNNVILIPKLNFHNCKRLRKRYKSKLASLNHCWFVDYLKEKSKEYPYCKVIQTTEEWTSKTCGSCGIVDYDLGTKREYNCKNCKCVFDRDSNASRNILLKYLTKSLERDLVV